MSFTQVRYAGNASADTNRGPSPAIWGSCPITELQEDSRRGMYFDEDFNDFPDVAGVSAVSYNAEQPRGKWATWVGNSSSAYIGSGADTNLPLEGGVIGLYGGTTTIDLTMAATSGAFRLLKDTSTTYVAGQKLWFECSIAMGTNMTTSAYGDLFVGLMDNGAATGTRITSAASLAFSATNTLKTATGNGGCIGFWKRATTNPTDITFVHNVNNGAVQNLGAAADLLKLTTNYAGAVQTTLSVTNGVPAAVNNTSGTGFTKLGFLFDPAAQYGQITTALTGQTAGNTKRKMLRLFVNGKEIAPFYDPAIVQAATFPLTAMCPVIAYRAGGTGAGICYVDFIRVAQLAAS